MGNSSDIKIHILNYVSYRREIKTGTVGECMCWINAVTHAEKIAVADGQSENNHN